MSVIYFSQFPQHLKRRVDHYLSSLGGERKCAVPGK